MARKGAFKITWCIFLYSCWHVNITDAFDQQFSEGKILNKLKPKLAFLKFVLKNKLSVWWET